MYLFFFPPPFKSLCVLVSVILVSSYTILSLLCHFSISILFSIICHGPSWPSLFFLIIPCTCGRSALFHRFSFFYLVPFLILCWYFLKPFPYWWFHYCGHLCFVCVWYLSPGDMLEKTYSPIGAVSTHKFDTEFWPSILCLIFKFWEQINFLVNILNYFFQI